MNIYTSYFGNIKTLEKDNIMPVAICCYPPCDLNVHNYRLFAPSRDILANCRGNIVLYKERFKQEILDILPKDDVLKFIEELSVESNGKDVALCCYEKPGEFCHRHIVAEYLNQNFGLNIVEYTHAQSVNNALF